MKETADRSKFLDKWLMQIRSPKHLDFMKELDAYVTTRNEIAMENRWVDVRNKLLDKFKDILTDDQMINVLVVLDDEQWFPRFKTAMKKEATDDTQT